VGAGGTQSTGELGPCQMADAVFPWCFTPRLHGLMRNYVQVPSALVDVICVL
jgi:hypothetical protein